MAKIALKVTHLALCENNCKNRWQIWFCVYVFMESKFEKLNLLPIITKSPPNVMVTKCPPKLLLMTQHGLMALRAANIGQHTPVPQRTVRRTLAQRHSPPTTSLERMPPGRPNPRSHPGGVCLSVCNGEKHPLQICNWPVLSRP